ncbi:bax inhibitor 1 [Artemisia annua]|uniref:Bax inhibitor 1 n=1 Tax=Artemisia annua TaxID=35608 RepID=A0A2U1P0J6_ARTAN|nr:bax inhibitor 1 [Artemisia annua]
MNSVESQPQSASSPSNSWSDDSLKNIHQIHPVVQAHLKRVYLSLCFALLSSAFGAYLHTCWNIGGVLTTFATLGVICWLQAMPPHETQIRVCLLMVAALLQGASIGPLIKLAINLNPSILVSAFVGTSIAFACFSVAAMLARRKEYLYLGGLLSSGLSLLIWVHFASSIFGGSWGFKISLYFGLLVFVGYMVYDTQDIIERAHLGDFDYVAHALILFTDFIAVFVRILIIMMKNSDDREERRKRRRD